MEKIYMNDDNKNQKKSFFKKFFNDKGSMLAVVVLAVVGIVSLVAFGFNQISFAADDDTVSGLGESFESAQFSVRTIGVPGEGSGFPTQVYTTTNNTFVYCIEYGEDYLPGKTYTKNQIIDDIEKNQGLIYLMSTLDSKLNAKLPQYNLEGEQEDRLVQWITQTAIWSYLYQTEGASGKNSKFGEYSEQLGGIPVEIVKAVNYLYSQPIGSGVAADIFRATKGSIYEEFGINELINTAINLGENWIDVNKKSDNISITNDNKYYQTDLISVISGVESTYSNDILFNRYSVDLSKAPEGTILVDESGNVYSDVSNMSPSSKFYLRVPVSKVKDENKNFAITVRGYFNAYGGELYTSTDSPQPVVDIKLIENQIEKPLNISINYTPPVENTGMSTAQTIYFIGLIILLSGVGIIYANSKPQGSN